MRFLVLDGFVNLFRNGRTGFTAGLAAFDHYEHDVAWLLVGSVRGKPGREIDDPIARISHLCRSGLGANAHPSHSGVSARAFFFVFNVRKHGVPDDLQSAGRQTELTAHAAFLEINRLLLQTAVLRFDAVNESR